MKNTLRIVLAGLAITVSVSMQAAFTLTHKAGLWGMQENGQQAVHTDVQILYAKPGEVVRLHRPDRCSLNGYVRWYCYDTDRAAERIEAAHQLYKNDNGTVDYTGNVDTYTLQNEYGWFKNKIGSRYGALDKHFYELDYTMHEGGSVYRIACDQSIYSDYTPATWASDVALTEPTLSKRLIYEMHPAAEMADRMEAYKNADENTYLEVHEMIAPVGRQLYIGPDYRFYTKAIYNVNTYIYESRSNYYYNSNGVETIMNNNDNWMWSIDGGTATKASDMNSGIIAGQFIAVSATSAGTHTYMLQYRSAGNNAATTYNVAKFVVTFMEAANVGPAETLPAPTRRMELIYENRFNYNEPGELPGYQAPTSISKVSFWNGHLGVDESTYGYYIIDKKSSRSHHDGEPTWSEYGVVNAQDVWVNKQAEGDIQTPWIYNHVDGSPNAVENAQKGYMIFVDGSEQPGLLFNIDFHTDLCPGSTMYFSAWVIDASSTAGTYNCAPNLDFIVIGEDALGNEHILTTYTTGEFGINAVENVSNPSVRMERAKWYKIMFPVKFEATDTYPKYRLKIMNKGKSSDGNDFAIDDIRIYMQKPPVTPMQSSTYGCPSGTTDDITAYLRVDYQAIDMEGHTSLYYQWRDNHNAVLSTNYTNMGVTSTEFGCVPVLSDDAAIEASGLTSASLLAFDTEFRDTDVPVYRYIKEQVDGSTKRYVLYIAQPVTVRTNYVYTGYVSVHKDGLGDQSGCGTHADLMIAGGTRITVNDEALGEEVTDICGYRSYKLDIVLTYIMQNEETGELEEGSTPCRADWLVGDEEYVNAHPEQYLYSFAEIADAVADYRTASPAAASRTIVRHLLKHSLLTLNSATATMLPGTALSYTAFPVGGSAANGMEVCLTPRFLHIRPDQTVVNMMAVGNKEEALPAVVTDRPRFVRISDSQKKNASFQLPTYRMGTASNYVIKDVKLVASTCPGWTETRLDGEAKNGTKTVASVDNLRIYGDGLLGLKAGYDYTFHVAFADEDQGCERGYTYFTLRIVPDTVTWLGGDWNVDDSWDSFVPLASTNVILLPQAYSVTFDANPVEAYDINYKRNECNNIYLPDGASVAGQERIAIHGQAFIDIRVDARKWGLVSIPIKGVVSGDMFASQNETDDPFSVAAIRQTVNTSAADRNVYEVYNSEYDAENDRWIVATNTLTRPMVAGEASMIGIDCASGAVNPVIRLPKRDNTYNYYNTEYGRWLYDSETVVRDGDYGKPVYTGDNDFTLKEVYEGVYLFGNPTFGYVDIARLVADNSDKLTGKYYWKQEGVTGAPYNEESTVFNRDVADDAEPFLLPPYRGVLLEGKSSSQQLTINVSSAMVVSSGGMESAPGRRAGGTDGLDKGGGMATGSKGALYISERDDYIREFFYPYVDRYMSALIMERTLYKDGYFNTLCLPFSMDAGEIAGSDLAGCELFAFDYAEKIANGDLELYMSPVDAIEAGIPYLIRWANTGEVITNLYFFNVKIETADGYAVGNGIRFMGSVPCYQMNYQDRDNLFIGSGNQFHWPNTYNPMRGFRACFKVPTEGKDAVVKYGAPARLVLGKKTATDTERVSADGSGIVKVVENGCVYIIRDGKRYDMLGIIQE
ncbi:MAG: hypothetical protein J6Y00_06910 [Paludibacteraceae bacterium]|nr:hypothetical protein [Paludibacteraceae bacterium]